ncbi:MAG: benzoate/H(+) symporter BenE family transporter [Bacillus subtilis]|nr:benzoate/H(+) symporter BenE family transporter [Bacillus subtilis]
MNKWMQSRSSSSSKNAARRLAEELLGGLDYVPRHGLRATGQRRHARERREPAMSLRRRFRRHRPFRRARLDSHGSRTPTPRWVSHPAWASMRSSPTPSSSRLGFPWQEALAAVLISGLIFVVISLTKIRAKIINAIPKDLKLAIGAGIGFFIAFIGLKNAGVVVANARNIRRAWSLRTIRPFYSDSLGIVLIFVLFAVGKKVGNVAMITTIVGNRPPRIRSRFDFPGT